MKKEARFKKRTPAISLVFGFILALVISPVSLFADWVYVSTGMYHTVAVGADGSLWAWGWNHAGQLGDGTTETRLTPTRIGTDTNWASVAAGSSHSAAIRTDGSLWAWGSNFFGQLGDGTDNSHLTPTQMGMDTNWVSVSVGNGFTAAIRADSSLWVWGINHVGQLGDGTRINRHNPIRVGTGTAWASVAAGNGRTVAIGTDGSLWAWGGNWEGWHRSDIIFPSRVETGYDWAFVSTGYGGIVITTHLGILPGTMHIVAIKTDSSLWTAGSNYSGQFGNDEASPFHYWFPPTQTGTDYDWVSVSAGAGFTVAVKKDGSLWKWGTMNPLFVSPAPVRKGSDYNWVSVSAGMGHVIAIRADGTVWAWGLNTQGQLGDGTRENRQEPVPITKP